MRKQTIFLSCFVSMLFSTASSAAGQVQGNLGVQLVISSGCSVSGGTASSTGNDFGTLNFGSYASLTNTIRAQTTAGSSGIRINCTNALPYSISLDNGAHSSSNQRRLADGSGNYINYNIYQDSAYAIAWSSTTPKVGVGSGTATDLVFYGSVPGGQTAAAGTYSDTVVVTVSW
jgi:spore coat protein U-like protein